MSSAVSAQNLRTTYLRAEEAIRTDPAADVTDALETLADYPLRPYLEYRLIERDLKTVAPETVDAWLAAYPDVAIRLDLKRAWLKELIRSRRDELYLRYDLADLNDPELNCHAQQLQGEAAELKFIAWFETAQSLGPHCGALAQTLYRAKRLPAVAVLNRIQRAFDERRAALGVATARSFAPDQLKAAQRALTVANNAALARKLVKPEAYARAALRTALVQLARRDHATALVLLNAQAARFGFTDADRWAVRREVAVFSAVALEPIALQRLADLPASEHTPQSRMWRLRSALAARDPVAVLAALDGFDAAEAASGRALYWRAWAMQQQGDAVAANAVLTRAAEIPDFYGFAASAELAQAPALCARPAPPNDAGLKTRNLALARALELHALKRELPARREWNQALLSASDTERAQMAQLAIALGWYRQAVITLAREPDRRLYDLRFPLAWEQQVSARARAAGVNPALVYAVMRAESALDPNAVSGANAHGLMQLLPGTASVMAKRLKTKFNGTLDLYRPDFNIRLGTAYLAERMAEHGNDVIATLAAYNAGPNVLKRWQSRLPQQDALLFVELMPYAETRDYVQRVIGFAMVYDYQLNARSVRSLHYWTQNQTQAPLLQPICP